MHILPAIDLQNGQCVRLYQGDFNQSVTYSKDPLAMAQMFVEAGAKRLHIIDLDGAEHGHSDNIKVIESMCKQLQGIEIQLGGGIRSIENLDRWFQLGVNYAMISTVVFEQPGFLEQACQKYPNQIMLALDEKNGSIAYGGWTKQHPGTLEDFLPSIEHLALEAILHTDISRDGTLTGANIARSVQIANLTKHPVVVAGGVRSIQDVIDASNSKKLHGIILGRALYEHTLDLKEAVDYQLSQT